MKKSIKTEKAPGAIGALFTGGGSERDAICFGTASDRPRYGRIRGR